MKNIKLLKLATDYLTRHLKQSILSVLVFAVSLILISFTLLLYFQGRSAYELVDRVLPRGMEGTGVIRFDDDFLGVGFSDAMKFMDDLYNLPEIDAVGTVCDGGMEKERLPGLYEIQEGHAQTYSYTLEGCLEVHHMNATLWHFFDTRLSEGMPAENLVFSDDSENYHYYLYLGDAYRGHIGLGEKFINANPYYSTTYEVAGFFEKGVEWADPWIANKLNLASFSFVVDHAVVLVSQYWLNTGAALFSTGYAMDDVLALIEETAKEHGLAVSLLTLRDVHQKSFEEYDIIVGYLTSLVGVVLFGTLTIMICMQIVGIYNSQKDYGILMSSGFFRADMVKVIAIKTAMTMILSVAITDILIALNAQRWYAGSPAWYMQFILWERIFPVTFLIAIAVTLVTLIVTVIIFNRFSVVKLIRG